MAAVAAFAAPVVDAASRWAVCRLAWGAVLAGDTVGLGGCAEMGGALDVGCGVSRDAGGRDSAGCDGACDLACGAAAGVASGAVRVADASVTTLAMMTWSVLAAGVGVVNNPWPTNQITPAWASTTAPVTRHVASRPWFRRGAAWGCLRSGRLGGRWDRCGRMANRGLCRWLCRWLYRG